MPNDFFRWEEGGALKHHCPECQHPLAHPRAKLRCIGKHVEWCNRYHCQLFKTGDSGTCKGCISSNKHRQDRYLEIAELVKKLHDTTDEQSPSPAGSPGLLKPDFSALIKCGTTKKERKAAKKASKAAERAPAIVSSKDIEHIGQVLHPGEASNEQFEHSLLLDKSIENNVFYHAGTGNSREVRHHIISQERAGMTDLKIPDSEMERIMLELKVPILCKAEKSENALAKKIHEKVSQDLIHHHGEEQENMKRKASFWRWASRKAYNRLVANGRIWDWKNGDVLAPVAEPEADGVEQDAIEARGQDDAENDGDHNSVTSGSTVSSRLPSVFSASISRDTSTSSASRTTIPSSDESDDDGWTVVGPQKSTKLQNAPKKKKGPPTTLKLCSNGGLSHLGSPKTASPWGAISADSKVTSKSSSPPLSPKPVEDPKTQTATQYSRQCSNNPSTCTIRDCTLCLYRQLEALEADLRFLCLHGR